MILAIRVAESFHSSMENSEQLTLFVNSAGVAIDDLEDTETGVLGAERFEFEFRSKGILGGGLCPENNKRALQKMNFR
jgi:hypothetical protein